MEYSDSADRGEVHNVCLGGNESSLKDSKDQWTLGSLELIDSHSRLSSLEHIVVGNIGICMLFSSFPVSGIAYHSQKRRMLLAWPPLRTGTGRGYKVIMRYVLFKFVQTF